MKYGFKYTNKFFIKNNEYFFYVWLFKQCDPIRSKISILNDNGNTFLLIHLEFSNTGEEIINQARQCFSESDTAKYELLDGIPGFKEDTEARKCIIDWKFDTNSDNNELLKYYDLIDPDELQSLFKDIFKYFYVPRGASYCTGPCYASGNDMARDITVEDCCNNYLDPESCYVYHHSDYDRVELWIKPGFEEEFEKKQAPLLAFLYRCVVTREESSGGLFIRLNIHYPRHNQDIMQFNSKLFYARQFIWNMTNDIRNKLKYIDCNISECI